jgi:hypothetical protein
MVITVALDATGNFAMTRGVAGSKLPWLRWIRLAGHLGLEWCNFG